MNNTLKILLVEDCPSNVLIIELYLQDEPVEIHVAKNGQVGVDMFKSERYELVLMDIMMPVMDGLDATRLMREYERENGLVPVPIVAVTAHASQENRSRAAEVGCSGFLCKPVRKSTLMEVVSEADNRRSLPN